MGARPGVRFGAFLAPDPGMKWGNGMDSVFEKLLKLGGVIWPPTHDDPRVKGPQPHILSRRQQEALEKMREGNRADDDRKSRSHLRPSDVGEDLPR